MQNNIRQAQQTASEEYQKKSQALIAPIMEKAKKAVEKVAKSQGYQYVLDSANGSGVIVSDGKDLFNEVKKRTWILNYIICLYSINYLKSCSALEQLFRFYPTKIT